MKGTTLIRAAIAISMLVLTVLLGFGINSKPTLAATATSQPLVGTSAASIDQKVKSEVNDLIGAGTSDQLEGYVQKTKGTAKIKLGQLTNTVENMSNQLEDQVESDITQVKEAFQDAVNIAEDTTETFLEDVKDVLE